MAPAEKLQSYLIEEILCRLPTKSLARVRAVSKAWNTLWEDKRFLKKYLARTRPQFIVWTNSHICSVGIIDLDDEDGGNPRLEVRHITSDIPVHTSLAHCDGFLLSSIWKKGFEVWNPWLRRKRLVENHVFRFCGLGYDNSRPETTGYKILGYDFSFDTSGQLYQNVAIYDCKSDAWNFITNAPCEQDLGVPQLDTILSLNGNLYWIAYHSVARQYFIRSFDFSKEMFKTFCRLPHSEQDFGYTQVLAVFRGDRFSLLRQSYMTRKIDIFVTKHKMTVMERPWHGCVS
ncbi:F-box protein At3g17710 [Capsella rubella]|uniref:F-box protein At3g17710 n=1 Tax=Capsella rubella TaxID=81985 RepID=UPI000CD4E6D6|nr:F-box protein At3g17710 [Capsella rubella]